MNTIKTSKEALLEASRAMAAEKGPSSVNIRALAKRCGVAVGSVYNYFPSKAALLAETVAGVWADIFHMAEGAAVPTGFSDSVVWLLGCLRQGAESCPSFSPSTPRASTRRSGTPAGPLWRNTRPT